MPERLMLRNFQSAGDILMLTATVRDLHRCYPGRFVTDVRSSCSDLWIGNPWLTPLRDDEPGVRVVECQYPIIHKSNQAPWHFLFGFSEHLNDVLGLRIQPTECRGDVHLTPEEREWFARVQEVRGEARPYWLFASGGRWDYTIKWWDAARYQQVVDHLRGRIDFVQVGETHHHHPDVRGVTDLRERCDDGGCWKSRTLPLGDGDPKDAPGELCLDVVGQLPRCMDLIGADEVIRRVETHFRGGALSYLLRDNPGAPPPEQL